MAAHQTHMTSLLLMGMGIAKADTRRAYNDKWLRKMALLLQFEDAADQCPQGDAYSVDIIFLGDYQSSGHSKQ